jgi:class 3 adenylate cyclase/pimeloyl-ACP methyl ester carboxylesterase
MTEQQIRYARTSDGVDIAYTTAGSGPPLLVLRPFISPDVDAVIVEESQWRAPWLDLAEDRTVVIWDYRGSGLSGPAQTYTLESGMLDMQAVVDEIGAQRFDLMGMMTPSHFAVAYAASHPERVSRMALWNPGVPGASMRTLWSGIPDISTSHFREYADLAALSLFGWDRPEQARRFADFMAEHFTSETWAQLNDSIEAIDSTPVAPSVTAPSLVIIDRNVLNQRVVNPEAQQYMRKLAATIPTAQLSIVKKGDQRAFVPLIDSFLGAGRARSAPVEVPSGTAIILFADIVDSTALTERLGDDAFRDKARGLDEAMRAAIRSNGGTAIEGKTLGDGVLAVFTSAKQAIACAQACHAAAGTAGLSLHAGIHAGDVIREADPDGRGNVYGGAVNIAARVAAEAAAGETLVSGTVRDLARTSAGVTFEDRGEQALKGIDDPVRLFAVRQE